jgi:hypothetical protein
MGKNQIFIFYIIGSCVYLFCVLANLAVKDWARYCFWDFGLIRAECFTSISDFADESTILDVIGDTCGSLRPIIESICPNACTNIYNFAIAGGILMCFSAVSCFTTIICIFFHIRALLDSEIQIKTISFFMCLPFVSFTIGFLCYAGISGVFKGIEVSGNYNTWNLDISIGFYFACGNLGLGFLVLLCGLLRSKKFMLKKFH